MIYFQYPLLSGALADIQTDLSIFFFAHPYKCVGGCGISKMLKFLCSKFLCDGQSADRGAILYVVRSCCLCSKVPFHTTSVTVAAILLFISSMQITVYDNLYVFVAHSHLKLQKSLKMLGKKKEIFFVILSTVKILNIETLVW